MEYRKCNISDLSIDLNEVYLTMGYKGEPDKDIEVFTLEILAEITTFCQPQYMYEIYDGDILSRTEVSIGPVNLQTGRIIGTYLSEASKFCVFVTTAGHEFEEFQKRTRTEGDLVKEFILDSLGSVIADTCVSKIAGELPLVTGLQQTYPYSPGYCGWKLTEQKELFSLLPEYPCGITLTESCLMLPIKSISGIIALGKEIQKKAYRCAICESTNCYKRK